jgi:hypothetical protein
MLILFQSPNGEPPDRRRAAKMTLVGLFTAIGVILLLVFTRGLMPPLALISVVIIMVVLATAALVMLLNGSSRAEKDKRKRRLDGQDIYTIMDRLVDDLDDDELAYLQKRIDERQTTTKDDLAQSVEDVLERRAQNRRQ